jgi:antagonist of KipI
MLEILEPALFTSVQDAGRTGWQAFGVPRGGPMDAFAHRAANLLVANPPGAAALEIGITSAHLLAHTDCVIAAGGAGFGLFVDAKSLPLWTSVYVRAGQRIWFEKVEGGNWAVLAIHGAIQSPPAPARLQSGQILAVGRSANFPYGLAGRQISRDLFDYAAYRSRGLFVLPGPQESYFTADSLDNFYSHRYQISPNSDRVGYRLTDSPLQRAHGGELLSEGMARGCIQVPPDGQPIVMQADCPTTGGYPKVAALIAADQPILAQIPLGAGQFSFAETDIASAQAEYRARMRSLDEETGRTSSDDDYLWAGF